MSWRWERRLRSGYTDMGTVQIPPVPQVIQLTDRTSGLKWFVSYITSPTDRIILSDTFNLGILSREGYRTYKAWEEPPMGDDGQFRLFVDNGRIGLEFSTFPVGVQDGDVAPIYARIDAAFRVVDFASDNPATIHLGLET